MIGNLTLLSTPIQSPRSLPHYFLHPFSHPALPLLVLYTMNDTSFFSLSGSFLSLSLVVDGKH